MTIEERLRKIDRKTLAVLGLFLGIGFTVGFLTGFGYGYANRPALPQVTQRGEETAAAQPNEIASSVQAVSLDAISSDRAEFDEEDDSSETPIENGEFTLTEHELDDDENGLFISGTVVNQSKNAFDAVQVVFELCDAKGKPYTTVSDRTTERMEPGDSWGFVVYIPYSEMRLFDSYRLQGIMGIRK